MSSQLLVQLVSTSTETFNLHNEDNVQILSYYAATSLNLNTHKIIEHGLILGTNTPHANSTTKCTLCQTPYLHCYSSWTNERIFGSTNLITKLRTYFNGFGLLKRFIGKKYVCLQFTDTIVGIVVFGQKHLYHFFFLNLNIRPVGLGTNLSFLALRGVRHDSARSSS